VQLVPISDGENHRVAGLGNVLVCVYWGEPSLAALHDRVEWVERTIERGSPVALFVVVTADAVGKLPGPAFRAESKRQAARYRDSIVLSASVIEGQGVTQTLVRSFLRGLATVAGRGMLVRFFGESAGAASWAAAAMAPHGGPEPEAILEAVARVRAAHDAAQRG